MSHKAGSLRKSVINVCLSINTIYLDSVFVLISLGYDDPLGSIDI